MQETFRAKLNEQAPEEPRTRVEAIVQGTRWAVHEIARGAVQATGDVLHFGVDATGHLLGKTGRSLVTGSMEAYRAALGEQFRADVLKKSA